MLADGDNSSWQLQSVMVTTDCIVIVMTAVSKKREI